MEDVKAGTKVPGVVANLRTFSKDGKRIDSKLVFIPYCTYYIPKWNDEWGETEFTDPEAFIDEFGEDVVKKVEAGQIVPVKHSLSEFSVKKQCAYSNEFIIHKSHIIYPVEGTAERLVRKDIYDKMHKE